jgi:hypothetical protein
MRKGILGVLVLSLFFGISTLRADELAAHIRGTVSDPTRARVPGAQVVATNTATKVSTTVTSSADGTFEFLNLPVGPYDVAVSKAGFKTSTTRHIVLQLNQVYDLSASLELGQTTETVQVEASPVQVETNVTQMGTVMENQQIVDLPILNRDWLTLNQLIPGAVGASDRFAGVGTTPTYSTNGQESQQNSFLINGADTMDLRLNQALMIPSEDAIGEFNLIDSTINPEYGRNSGAVMNAILKSGTNQFHGTVFEFYRDTFLNARNFFQISPTIFHQNQFGGVLDGPVVRNHLFFMISYQGTYNRAPDQNSQESSVPVFTQAQRNGLFPDLAQSTNTSPIPLVASNGATMAAGTAYNVLFPTGQIPAADFNPLSVALMNKYVPLPNQPGGLFGYDAIQTGKQNQGVARIDETVSSKDTIWGSLFLQNSPTVHNLPFLGSSLPGFGETDGQFTSQFVGAWDHTFNSTTLNELRFSFTRFNYNSVAPSSPALPSSFGFQGITPEFPNNASMPFVNVLGYFNLGFSPDGPQPVIENTYQLDDNFSKVRGNHTMKFGFDGRRYEVDNPFEAVNNGEYSFDGAGQYSTGDPGADFLLGFPDSFVQQSGGVQDFRSYEIYLYAQDSWKIKRNLTLNYGLGWQYDSPLENHYFNNLDNNCFIPGQQSVIFPTAPVGLEFPGDKGCSLSGYYPRYDHFAPRFGFAWSPSGGGRLTGGGKFVVRGGFGVYFNRTEEELGLQQLSAAPFLITSFGAGNIGGSPSFINPYVDIATGSVAPSPFPFAPPTKGSSPNFSAFEPFDINVVNPNLTDPYSMNFNLNVQRELPGSMILQVAYVGALGRHLELAYEGNPISPSGQAACAANPTCVSERASQAIDFPTHTLYEPGNEFVSVGTQATRGSSDYNSLQISLNKRMSHGLQFLLAYTLSHSMDNTSGYESSGGASGFGVFRAPNPYQLGSSYWGNSSFDARNRFVFSAVWDIPSATKRWNNVFSRYVLDGWKLTGVETLQSGFPILIFDQSLNSLSCNAGFPVIYYACWDTPNVVGPVTYYNPRNSPNNLYFSPSSFSDENIGQIGNEGRNNVHGPGINQTNLSLIKDIKFTEIRRLELRLDSFNTFNHTQFQMESNSLQYSDFNSPNFGRALSAADGRIVQLAVKFYF